GVLIDRDGVLCRTVPAAQDIDVVLDRIIVGSMSGRHHHVGVEVDVTDGDCLVGGSGFQLLDVDGVSVPLQEIRQCVNARVRLVPAVEDGEGDVLVVVRVEGVQVLGVRSGLACGPVPVAGRRGRVVSGTASAVAHSAG